MRTIIFCAALWASVAWGQDLQKIVDDTAAATLAESREKNLQESELGITVIDLRDADKPLAASFRGDAGMYPASVVKLFYLAAAEQWLEDGKLADSPELQRALRDMIVDSSNEATQFIVDAVTGTSNGLPLSDAEMQAWSEKRNAVNRWYSGLGYAGINVCQKTYGEGPYGRERLFLGKSFENRNKLTTSATARLLCEIMTDKIVTPARCADMRKLLSRNPSTKPSSDNQATDFSARGLSGGETLWSKAGWTSTTRHDAACIERPDGHRVIIVTFTTNHANDRTIIPAVVKRVMDGIR